MIAALDMPSEMTERAQVLHLYTDRNLSNSSICMPPTAQASGVLVPKAVWYRMFQGKVTSKDRRC